MLSWGGEASIVCFAELCIFKKIIMIPDVSLVLAEKGRVLHLQMGCFSTCPTQPEYMSHKSGCCCRAIEVFRGGSFFISVFHSFNLI